jgi:glyoxylase-like metal-dependent hydrolase (beta-lactamase superfamily II)
MRCHLAARDHVIMDWAPALYMVRTAGHLGALALSAFPGMTAQQQGTHTVLTGWLDQSALYGVLAELESLGLVLIEVRLVQPHGQTPESEPDRRQKSPESSDDPCPPGGDPWRDHELADAHGQQRRAPRTQGETVTSSATGASDTPDLPEYAPLPAIAKGMALNEHGYHVSQVERNLYAVTDNVYMSAFLTTPDGVVIFDAPPNIGHNIRRAVDEVTAANGLTNQVTHMVYSHHHDDHQGASSLFGGDIVRIGHEETRRLLLREGDSARPAPDVTFSDTYTLEVGGERVELAWHGPNHSPDNIYIHFPDHDTLMFIDVVNAGWVPIYNLNLSDDVIGYTAAPAIALDYPWTHLISGHLGRVATREDVALHQQYIADIEASSREALATVNPGPLFQHYGENVWAGVSAYLDAVTEHAAAPVVAKYTGVLGGADIEVFTRTTTFAIMQSIRLDRGHSGPVHP